MAAAAALAMVLSGPALAESGNVTERLGIPGPIRFQDKAYALAWSSRPSPTYFKQEYVPAGQSVKSYTEMFLVEALTQPLTPTQSAAAQVETLKRRKETDPVVNYAIARDEKTGAVLLDFVVSDLKANPAIIEWNAYRYVPLQGRPGVALYAISRRGYGDADAKALLQGLKASRRQDVNALALLDLPRITVAD